MQKELAYNLIKLAKEIKSIVCLPMRFFKINRIVNKPSYYPELPRKTRLKRWMDNVEWLLKDKLLNAYYTSYGLDVNDFHRQEDYIPQRTFIKTRNAGNQILKLTESGDYNYIVLLRDKYVFASYLSAVIGSQYVVESVGIVDRGRLFLKKKNTWSELETLIEMDGNWVFKVIDGECGDGVYLISISNGEIFASGQKMNLESFSKEILKDARWLIQPVVKQHPALEVFGTKSVNTIRIITIRGKSGTIGVFNAFFRIGADKDSFVDNRALGGFGVGVDLETGQLMRYGFQHDHFGGKAEKHPLSGIVFEGYQIPYWQETIELIKRAHLQFYEFQSIGWDVVITKDGPILLEGNDDWEIGGPQDTAGGLKKRWAELTNA